MVFANGGCLGGPGVAVHAAVVPVPSAPASQDDEKKQDGTGAAPGAPGALGGVVDPLSLVEVKAYHRAALARGVAQRVWVLLEVETDVRPAQRTREPINLGVVLDVSGSMSGDKLKQCLVAIDNIITAIQPGDLFHLVVYHNTARTIFEGGRHTKDEMRALVAPLKAAGGTDIAAGLNAGRQVILSHATTTIPGNRQFLFSDGADTKGNRKEALALLAKTAHAEGISTCTFGIGANYDQAVMGAIAEAGKGESVFIDSPACIPRLVEDGLQNATSVLAMEAKLKVRGAPGAVVRQVYGHPFEAIAAGVSLGGLPYNDSVQVLVEVEAAPSADGEYPLLEWYLEAMDVATKTPLQWKGGVSILARADPLAVPVAEDARVEVYLGLQKMKAVDEECAQLVRDKQAQKAIALKEKAVAELEVLLPKDATGVVVAVLLAARELLHKLQTDYSAGLAAKAFQDQAESSKAGANEWAHGKKRRVKNAESYAPVSSMQSELRYVRKGRPKKGPAEPKSKSSQSASSSAQLAPSEYSTRDADDLVFEAQQQQQQYFTSMAVYTPISSPAYYGSVAAPHYSTTSSSSTSSAPSNSSSSSASLSPVSALPYGALYTSMSQTYPSSSSHNSSALYSGGAEGVAGGGPHWNPYGYSSPTHHPGQGLYSMAGMGGADRMMAMGGAGMVDVYSAPLFAHPAASQLEAKTDFSGPPTQRSHPTHQPAQPPIQPPATAHLLGDEAAAISAANANALHPMMAPPAYDTVSEDFLDDEVPELIRKNLKRKSVQ